MFIIRATLSIIIIICIPAGVKIKFNRFLNIYYININADADIIYSKYYVLKFIDHVAELLSY